MRKERLYLFFLMDESFLFMCLVNKIIFLSLMDAITDS